MDYDLNESVSVLDGIKAVSPNVFYHDYSSKQSTQMEAYDAVIVVIGEHYSITGEARAVTSIELTDKDRELIIAARRMNKKVIGVLLYARPMALESVIDMFDAVIFAWHSGSQTGTAVADILFGKCSPSGRLPVTLPRHTGQNHRENIQVLDTIQIMQVHNHIVIVYLRQCILLVMG